MQLTLKDVGKMSSLPGISVLTTSHVWNQPIEKIHPTQLHAFVDRLAHSNMRDVAETAVHICLKEVKRAVACNEIPEPHILQYKAPLKFRLTNAEFRKGLQQMGVTKGAAVLFALETGMDGHAVGRMTWSKLMRMFKAAVLTDSAIACTRICPRQLHLQYVFWEEGDDQPTPLFSLDHDVFEAFGAVWAELETAYARL